MKVATMAPREQAPDQSVACDEYDGLIARQLAALLVAAHRRRFAERPTADDATSNSTAAPEPAP